MALIALVDRGFGGPTGRSVRSATTTAGDTPSLAVSVARWTVGD
jgi:hypothetical protein